MARRRLSAGCAVELSARASLSSPPTATVAFEITSYQDAPLSLPASPFGAGFYVRGRTARSADPFVPFINPVALAASTTVCGLVRFAATGTVTMWFVANGMTSTPPPACPEANRMQGIFNGGVAVLSIFPQSALSAVFGVGSFPPRLNMQALTATAAAGASLSGSNLVIRYSLSNFTFTPQRWLRVGHLEAGDSSTTMAAFAIEGTAAAGLATQSCCWMATWRMTLPLLRTPTVRDGCCRLRSAA